MYNVHVENSNTQDSCHITPTGIVDDLEVISRRADIRNTRAATGVVQPEGEGREGGVARVEEGGQLGEHQVPGSQDN